MAEVVNPWANGGANARGFLTADQAEHGVAADLIVHKEISVIEQQVLEQTSRGFMNLVVNNTYMTSSVYNPPITVASVFPTAITSGNVLTFESTSGVTPGMSVTDLTTPAGIPSSTSVVDFTSNQVVISNPVNSSGVLANDSIQFSTSLSATAQAQAGTNVLTFLSTSGVYAGMIVTDTTASAVILPGTTVVSLTSTTVTLSNNTIGLGVNIADSIQFAVVLPIVSANQSYIALNPFVANSTGAAWGVNDSDGGSIVSLYSSLQPSTDKIIVSEVPTNAGTVAELLQTTQTIPTIALPSGTAVMFTSTANLPVPLSTGTIYYLVATTTANQYQLATSKQNALETVPVTFDITTPGTGVLSMNVLLPSELYFRAWQNYYSNPEYRTYATQMSQVIDYFTSLQYTVNRLQATDGSGNPIDVLNWQLSW